MLKMQTHLSTLDIFQYALEDKENSIRDKPTAQQQNNLIKFYGKIVTVE